MAAITSAQDGDWNTGATWVGGVKPASGDTATIAHAVAITGAEACSGLTINTTKTLTIATGGALTVDGGTFVVTGTLQANGTATITTAVNVTGDGKINFAGTSGAIATFTSDSATTFRQYRCTGSSSWLWVNVVAIIGFSAVWERFERVWQKGVTGGNDACLYRSKIAAIKECFFSGGMRFSVSDIAPTNVIGVTKMTNVVIGYGRDGASAALYQSKTFQQAQGIPDINGAALLNGGATETAFDVKSRIVIDNYGYVPASMLPGTASALDSAVEAIGGGKVLTFAGNMERSSAAPVRTGTYKALFRPNASTSTTYPLELWFDVPVTSGENISASVYANRTGITNSCAKLVIDPEGNFYTTATSTEVLTNISTWYELTATGTSAAATGIVRVVLRVDANNSTDAVSFDDFSVTVGSSTYTADMSLWHNGAPRLIPPAGGASGGQSRGRYQ